MKVDIPNSVVLVTGSTQGVGLAIAREAAASGAEAVMLTGREVARGEAATEELRRMGVAADFIPAELLDEAAPRLLVDRTVERFGRVEWIQKWHLQRLQLERYKSHRRDCGLRRL